MRRPKALALSLLLVAVGAASADAQAPRFVRSPRLYLTLSDAIGVTGGGNVKSVTGLSQMMRVSGVFGFNLSHGVELSAIRVQELSPVPKRTSDPLGNDPRADGLLLSYASLAQVRGGGFPTLMSFGGGVLRRPTLTPGEHRETWGAQVGFETILSPLPVNWSDLSAGGRLLLMPGSDKTVIYMLAIGLGIRIG